MIKKSNKRIVFIFVIILLILCLSYIFKGSLINKKVYYYHDFPISFELSNQEVNDSLMKGEPIIIEDKLSFKLPEHITRLAEDKGWRVVEDITSFDGGSQKIGYLYTEHSPAVEISYIWDMERGRYVGMHISFIHPSDVMSWLSSISKSETIL